MILHLAPGSSLLARAVLRGSPILFVPEVAILGLLVFWLASRRLSGPRPE